MEDLTPTRSISEPAPATPHICLAGAVSDNWSLIAPLKRGCQVTVIERLDMLWPNSILATATVLVLDCGENADSGMQALRALRTMYPELFVVLVNGGLSQHEIAIAFREGATDYFSCHSNAALVVERVQYLCRQAGRRSRRVIAGRAESC